MSNYFLLSLLVLTYFLHFPSPEYVNVIKRLCRKLLNMSKSRIPWYAAALQVSTTFRDYAENTQMLYVYTLVVKWEAGDHRFRSPYLLYFRFSIRRSIYRTISLFGPPDMTRLLLVVALKAYINWLSTHCQHSLGFCFAFVAAQAPILPLSSHFWVEN